MRSIVSTVARNSEWYDGTWARCDRLEFENVRTSINTSGETVVVRLDGLSSHNWYHGRDGITLEIDEMEPERVDSIC